MNRERALRLFATTALALTILACTAAPAFAKSYTMGPVDIEVLVQPDGDMFVTERRTYDFNGDFTFAYWELPLDGAEGRSVSIGVLGMAMDGAAHTFTDASDAWDTRPPGMYQVVDFGDELDARIFYRKSDTTSVIEITYIVEGGVLRWDDTAEIYWKFIGDRWDLPARDITVHVVLPDGVVRDEVRAWAHGPLTGLVTINDDATVDLTVDRLPAYEFLEGRILFPQAAVPGAVTIPGPRLQHILDEEGRWADEANKERARARVLLWGSGAVTLVLPLLALAWSIARFFRHGKEYEPEFQGEYFRELPAELSPAVVGSLMKMGQPGADELTATLMDLISRGIVHMAPVTEEKRGLFGMKQETSYQLTLIREKLSELSHHEGVLLNHLFGKTMQADSFTINDLAAAVKGAPHGVARCTTKPRREASSRRAGSPGWAGWSRWVWSPRSWPFCRYGS